MQQTSTEIIPREKETAKKKLMIEEILLRGRGGDKGTARKKKDREKKSAARVTAKHQEYEEDEVD